MDTQIDRSTDISQPLESLHENERLKFNSRYLRGTIIESLDDEITGAVDAGDNKLMKFHGIYQQDDRDLREERRQQKLEPAYQFMIRVRLPGGVCTTRQWLAMDRLASEYADGSLRLTTRQTFQFHAVLKHNIRPLLQGLRDIGLDTRAACGDDTRGVMCAVNPQLSHLHAAVFHIAQATSNAMLHKTAAYEEIWYGQAGKEKPVEEEPVYGATYMPRKFKFGFAIPPLNDIDVFTQDAGFIAIGEGEDLLGFNVCVGGGMGRQDNNKASYPRLGDLIGYITADKVLQVARAILLIQRDYGDRKDRHHARFKYTLDTHGLPWFVDTLQSQLGFKLEAARPFDFKQQGDCFGWQQGSDGNWHYTLYIPNGRVKNDADIAFKDVLADIIEQHKGELRLTPNQNLVFATISPDDKKKFENMLSNLPGSDRVSRLQRNALACVAFPTCGLAMAESERYFPSLLNKIQKIISLNKLDECDISIRMSGCPNGCSRPYVAEIAFSGRAPGKYNMYLGGDHRGQRLNKLYKENISEQLILESLEKLLAQFAGERESGETFGDFVIRKKHVKAVLRGRDFND